MAAIKIVTQPYPDARRPAEGIGGEYHFFRDTCVSLMLESSSVPDTLRFCALFPCSHEKTTIFEDAL